MKLRRRHIQGRCPWSGSIDIATLTRLLKVTDQLVVVVPANVDAAGALADTRDWLDNNGHAELAMQSVTVINGRTQKVITTIKLHAQPWHLAVSPKTGDIYVINSVNDNVSVIRGKTDKVIATVSVAAKAPSGTPVDPYELAVSPVTGAVYVVSSGYHTGNVVTVISGEQTPVGTAAAMLRDLIEIAG